MSDKPTDADPVIERLREREKFLEREGLLLETRLCEVREMILLLDDGRSRVNRQRRQRATGNSSAPPLVEEPHREGQWPDTAAEQENMG
jgi:hypothetical protein